MRLIDRASQALEAAIANEKQPVNWMASAAAYRRLEAEHDEQALDKPHPLDRAPFSGLFGYPIGRGRPHGPEALELIVHSGDPALPVAAREQEMIVVC